MSKWMKRIAVFLICMSLVVSALPTAALAVTVKCVEPITETYINPCYADVMDVSALTSPSVVPLSDDDEYCYSIEEAAEEVRDELKDREQTVRVKIAYQGDYNILLREIFETALEHTGNPTEGDYLRWQYGGYQSSLSGYYAGGTYYLTLTYTVTYYTTEDQEEELDDAVDELLEQLDLEGKSDYQKVKAIYDWMTANIVYDYVHLPDETYKLQFTAYAAMMNKTSVCQGYATLLYRLLLEADVDCRVVTGYADGAHGWNIVCLNREYYNVDATWDAVYAQAGRGYKYFMVSDEHFSTDHTRDAVYTTEEFYAAYPMAAADLDPDTLVEDDRQEDGKHEDDKQEEDRPKEITSEVYPIENGEILGVLPGMTVSQLLASLDQGSNVRAFDGEKELRGDDQVVGLMTLVLMDRETEICSLRVILLGDVSKDGSMNNIDAATVLQYAADWEVEVDPRLADVNCDGKVNNIDAAMMLQYAAGWNITFGSADTE